MGYTAIVDYGVGNLKSVSNAMTYVGQRTLITGDSGELERADSVILPGVGPTGGTQADFRHMPRNAASV